MNTNTRNVYQEKAKAQLDKIKARMKLLQAEINDSKADARIELNRQMDALNNQYDDAKRKLEGLSGATKDAWQELQKGVDAAITELWQSVDSVIER